MIRTSISLALLVVLAASAAQAAPSGPQVKESIPVDKLYELTHPADKVGPPVDPSGPLFERAQIDQVQVQVELPAVQKNVVAR